MIDPAPGDAVAIVTGPLGATLLSGDADAALVEPGDISSVVSRLEATHRPRWVWWSKDTAARLIEHGIRPSRCWDLSAVHRVLHGGFRSGPDRVWAAEHGLDASTIPTDDPLDLFTDAAALGDDDHPVRPDGHLRPDWVRGAWADAPERMARWARSALDVHAAQMRRVDASADSERLRVTAACESAAEALCADLEHDGLPFDRATAEQVIAGFIGPRPRTAAERDTAIARLDDRVLRHTTTSATFDLRNPDQVKSLLRSVGVEVSDTRAWRLERMVDAHPIIAPLLEWRRAERIRTTFGYDWIDEHVDEDGRLRGRWAGSDGAAGRMTATGGLHNMPAEMRPAIAADDGYAFVRADLGQIEPRVLAAVSGDEALIAATQADDMYAPVARRLGVEREIAKVAVLGAMYGQTTGRGAEALRGLEREYPVAMGRLRAADEAAQGGHDLHTVGGRRIRMSAPAGDDLTDAATADRDLRSRAAARGRYGRNAIIQGAAAEFFKMWAVLVRARGQALDARIVLCLHDELIVHVPSDRSAAAAGLVDDCLQEAAHRWMPHATTPVRFVADTSVIARWSDAK